MADTLITTKLGIPRTRPNLVPRPHLVERLEEGIKRKLLFLSAPAGFGKTTLLGEWLESRTGDRPVAWVSLDEADSDPTRFLSYIVAVLRTIEEGIGEGVLAALHSPEPPRIEAIVGALVNEMAALSTELILVLDDYHTIGSSPVHDAVAFLLERLPPNLHLIIASRTEPPLPLAKLRARDQMVELGISELSFTIEEATSFLKDVMRLDLSVEDVATLEERTEGWIAGLQLAALSMRDRKDISSFIESFSGSNRGVLDFLAEEVLERQPGNVREFLLRTSVLGRLTGPRARLCVSSVRISTPDLPFGGCLFTLFGPTIGDDCRKTGHRKEKKLWRTITRPIPQTAKGIGVPTPLFIVTHEAPDTMPKGRVYAFVTDSIESALEQARAAAGNKDIAVMGGPDIRRQFVEAGLVDEKCRHAGPTTS